MVRAIFGLTFVALGAVGFAVLLETGAIAQGPPDGGAGGGRPAYQPGGRPSYQRRSFEGGWKGQQDSRRDGFNRAAPMTSPQVSSGWFQRPYPYHLDYYKMRYGGSYAPYFGNLYGTPFGTPQVVYGGWGLGAGGSGLGNGGPEGVGAQAGPYSQGDYLPSAGNEGGGEYPQVYERAAAYPNGYSQGPVMEAPAANTNNQAAEQTKSTETLPVPKK